MQVADYFADLKSQITNHPLVSSWRFQEEVRTRAIGWFKAEVAFQNGVILNLREFVIIASKEPTLQQILDEIGRLER